MFSIDKRPECIKLEDWERLIPFLEEIFWSGGCFGVWDLARLTGVSESKIESEGWVFEIIRLHPEEFVLEEALSSVG